MQKEKEERSRLKTIAGLIQSLTYREMNELATLLVEDVDTELFERVPSGLLKVADRILSSKEQKFEL